MVDFNPMLDDGSAVDVGQISKEAREIYFREDFGS